VKLEKGKTYILTGFVKTTRGTASLQIQHFSGRQWVGKTAASRIESDDWQQLAAVVQASQYPETTEIGVSAVGRGDFEGWFDAFRLVVLDASQIESSPYAKLAARSTRTVGARKAGAPRLGGWTLYQSDGGQVTWQFDSQETKGGKPSLYLKGTCKWASLAMRDKTKFDGRKDYMLTGSVKCKSGMAKLKFTYYDKNNKRLGGTDSKTVKPNDEWQSLSVSSQQSKYPQATYFRISAGGGGKLEAWYTDIEVKEK